MTLPNATFSEGEKLDVVMNRDTPVDIALDVLWPPVPHPAAVPSHTVVDRLVEPQIT